MGRTEAIVIYDTNTNQHSAIRLTVDSAEFSKQTPSKSVVGSKLLLVDRKLRLLPLEGITNRVVSVTGQIRTHPPRHPTQQKGIITSFAPSYSPQTDAIHVLVVEHLADIGAANIQKSK